MLRTLFPVKKRQGRLGKRNVSYVKRAPKKNRDVPPRLNVLKMCFLLLRALLQVTAFHFLGSVCYMYMHIPGTSESILELSHPPKWIQMPLDIR